jgi:hypothetical protein
MGWGTALGCRCQSTKPPPLPWAVASPLPPLTPTLAAPCPYRKTVSAASPITSALWYVTAKSVGVPVNSVHGESSNSTATADPLQTSQQATFPEPPPCLPSPNQKFPLSSPPPLPHNQDCPLPHPMGPLFENISWMPHGVGRWILNNAPRRPLAERSRCGSYKNSLPQVCCEKKWEVQSARIA